MTDEHSHEHAVLVPIASTPVPSDSGWRATVTCESGPGPIRLGVAPTEAQAIAAARWFIDSSQGCGGSGTYTVSRTQ